MATAAMKTKVAPSTTINIRIHLVLLTRKLTIFILFILAFNRVLFYAGFLSPDLVTATECHPEILCSVRIHKSAISDDGEYSLV